MRIIYLIIGFLSLALAIVGVCCPRLLFFCCLLLVFREVPSVLKIGSIIPNFIRLT